MCVSGDAEEDTNHLTMSSNFSEFVCRKMWQGPREGRAAGAVLTAELVEVVSKGHASVLQ